MQKQGPKLKHITDFQFRVIVTFSTFVIIPQLLLQYHNVHATMTLVRQPS